MKKLLPPQLFLIFSLLMGIVCSGFGFRHYIQYPYNLTGLVLLITGISIAQSGKNLFHKTGTNVNTFDKPEKLVTEGIYRFSRNPMYLGFVIALTGIAVLYQGSISSLILLFFFFLIVNRWYIRFEEKLMSEIFGEEYFEYCKRSRRWI